MKDNQETPLTKLPDGSGCFTAVIMSKEEAMALPVENRPICFRISSEMYHAVFEAIGAASMCWDPRPSNEVFASEQASDIAADLCFKIAKEVETREAQNMERITELEAGLKQALLLLTEHGGTQEKGNSTFAAEDVTKGERMIHAWSLTDAKRYINAILASGGHTCSP